MAARFILSFDCEGKWGVSDALSAAHRRDLTDGKLWSAYRSILTLLDEHQVEATFAFAGLFSQTAEQFCQLRHEVEDLAALSPDYVRPALNDIDVTGGSGWHGAQLVDAVRTARTKHEIALHGVTHVPWTRMSDEFLAGEMELFRRLHGPVRESRTFVYPRNCVAHVDALRGMGLVGFRTARAQRSRLHSLTAEFNLRAKPEHPVDDGGIVRIPAGYFLNWRSGPRRIVPQAVTVRRARNLLRHATRTGSVVHYWLHPENIATAPSTFRLLEALVSEVATARERGDCEVMTQLGYSQWIESLR